MLGIAVLVPTYVRVMGLDVGNRCVGPNLREGDGIWMLGIATLVPTYVTACLDVGWVEQRDTQHKPSYRSNPAAMDLTFTPHR